MNIGGYDPNQILNNIAQGFSGVAYPNGIAPEGMTPVQQGWEGIGNIGAAMLANNRKPPMQALGESYLMAQQQGLDNARQVALAEDLKSKKRERDLQARVIERQLKNQDANQAFIQNLIGGGSGGAASQPFSGQESVGLPNAGSSGGGGGGFGGGAPNLQPQIDRWTKIKMAAEASGNNDLAQAAGVQIANLTNQQNYAMQAAQIGVSTDNQTFQVLKDPYDAANRASTDQRVINQMRQMMDEGIFSGKVANWKLKAAEWGQAFGLTGPELDAATANTQAFKMIVGQRVATIVKNFGSGSGISTSDREYAEKMAGGNITVTEDALKRIFSIAERGNRSTIDTYNKRWAPIAKGGRLEQAFGPVNFDEYKFQPPEPVQQAPAATYTPPPGVTFNSIDGQPFVSAQQPQPDQAQPLGTPNYQTGY